ncbi:formate hydrogenlyase [Rhodoferax sp.]|uniref:formate hydrogenlyase n=1 Tax=Rhodoferax sp. TaxID=50421 RepID=UPI0019EF6698|nr:formate hydrogenlyase [Rhodoferax sp.]MBE0473781.1 formate hydrogenlyase [Rhodoferax sp.]
MEFAQLGLYNQAIILFSAVALLTSFLMLAQSRMLPLIFTFAWQGFLLATVTVLVAIVSDHPHLLVSAFLTFALKVVIIPWLLYRLSVQLKMQYNAEQIPHPTLLLIAGVALVIFSYFVSKSIVHLSGLATRNTIAVSVAIELLGMLLMCVRKSAVAQVIGFMSMESGIFFAASVSTYGMPLIVELGVAFDILVASILFGVFFFHLKDSFGTLDVGQYNRLSEANASQFPAPEQALGQPVPGDHS